MKQLYSVAFALLLVACNRAPSAVDDSVFDGEWISDNTMPPAMLSLTSRGDSLFGTLRLSGREVDVAGIDMRNSFRIQDRQNPGFSVDAVRIDDNTIEARFGTEPQVTVVLRRKSGTTP